MRFMANTANVRLRYSKHIFRDLRNLNMLSLTKLRRDLDRIFGQRTIAAYIFIPEE